MKPCACSPEIGRELIPGGAEHLQSIFMERWVFMGRIVFLLSYNAVDTVCFNFDLPNPHQCAAGQTQALQHWVCTTIYVHANPFMSRQGMKIHLCLEPKP